MKGKAIHEVFPDAENFVHFRAPGRINIIGEHTDYNDGFILPAAIDRYMQLAIRKNKAGIIRAYSREFPGMKQFHLPLARMDQNDGWEKYLKAVLCMLQKEIGFQIIVGLDIYVSSNIPIGAGLSSSAALEVVFLFALNKLFHLHISPIQMALFAQKAENDYAGVQCGIMDQFVSLMGKENDALFLDIQSMKFQYIPLHLGDYAFILIDTMISHSLDNSEYNVRRQECETGLTILQKCMGSALTSLREVNLKDMYNCRDQFPCSVFKRIIYVAEENLRVKEMVRVLRKKAFTRAGQLLYQSHNGLKYLYEVSCPELDFIVDYLHTCEGVLGARMMGGGFGGCVLTLIEKDRIKEISSFIKKKYKMMFKKYPRIYPIFLSSDAIMNSNH